jgi:hypothetical protein
MSLIQLYIQYPWCWVISFCERSYSGGSSITLPYCVIERLNCPASILTLLFKSLRVLVACRTCIVLRVERGAESSRINSLTHFQHFTSLLQICDWAIRVSLVLVYCIAASLAHWLPRCIFLFFLFLFFLEASDSRSIFWAWEGGIQLRTIIQDNPTFMASNTVRLFTFQIDA